jgi:hypothetical protein
MSVTFSYPTTAPTVSVTLPGPAFSDITNYDYPVQVYRAMAGTFYTHKKTPSKTTKVYSFNNIRLASWETFLTLVKTAKANAIRLIDYDTNNYSIKILSNPLDITHDAKDLCGDQISFQLQFQIISTLVPESSYFLLETEDNFLLETGDLFLLEVG